jgi:hypothetical protein
MSTCRPGFHDGSKWKRLSSFRSGRSQRTSQIKNRSSKERPSKPPPTASRTTPPCAPAQPTTYGVSTGPASVCTVTPDPWSSTAVTVVPHRTSTAGVRAICSSSSCSTRLWAMFTHGGNGLLPLSANSTWNSSCSRKNVRATRQVTPSAAIRRPTPIESHTSRTSRCWQIDRDPAARRRGSASSTRARTPQRARSSAVVCPTGPHPTTTTGGPSYMEAR